MRGNILLFHIAYRIVRGLQQGVHFFTHLGLRRLMANGVDIVGGFTCMLGHGVTVEVVHHRAQQGVAGQHEQGGQYGFRQHACTGTRTHRGRAPERGGGVQAGDIGAFLHDGAGTEKADA